ncbi:MAG TPA: hypothetical protein VJV96_03135 [Candidatus Angelobacter sp.]|jgi:hypothetical protein|nr:hypothetical protein [Candidatus Angelobacter sp.]
MVRFQCDTCGRLKESDEAWILGFAAENIGVTSARREVSISGTWDRPRAVEPLAVHFCSDECRAEYMNALFGETPSTREGEITVTKRRMKRVVPGGVVDTVVAERPGPTIVKRTVVRKKRAS